MSGEPTRWEVRACGLGHRLGTVLDRAYDAANRLVCRLTGDGYRTIAEQSSWTYQWGYEMGLKDAMARALAGEGMSTRAIAPIVGVSHMQVKRDADAAVTNVTPAVNVETGEVADAS